MVALKRAGFLVVKWKSCLLGAGVLGHGLGSLRDGVLGQFSRQEKPDRGLDLPGRDGRPLVVVSQTRSLSSDPLEDVVDKRVHDSHGLAGNSGVGVHLLQNFVHVNAKAFFVPSPSLLFAVDRGGLGY